MSDSPAANTSGNRKNPLAPGIKDAATLKEAALFLGWIAALVLIAALCWFLTQSFRSNLLQKAVNRVLEQSGDSRRLGEAVSPETQHLSFSGIGSWYTMEAQDKTVPGGTKVFVFVFIGEGTFFPCAAVLSPEGKVQEFIPLNSHGERMIKRVSPGILGIYTRRIEEAES